MWGRVWGGHPLERGGKGWGTRGLYFPEDPRVSHPPARGQKITLTAPTVRTITSNRHLHGQRRAYAESNENYLSGAGYHCVHCNNPRSILVGLGDSQGCNSRHLSRGGSLGQINPDTESGPHLYSRCAVHGI